MANVYSSQSGLCDLFDAAYVNSFLQITDSQPGLGVGWSREPDVSGGHDHLPD